MATAAQHRVIEGAGIRTCRAQGHCMRGTRVRRQSGAFSKVDASAPSVRKRGRA